jgi:hypothetical protein
MLNPQNSTVKHKVNSFAEWRKRAAIFYAETARRYRADTFVVVHEPSTMASRMGKKVNVSQWEILPVRRRGQLTLICDGEQLYIYSKIENLDLWAGILYS